MWCGESLDRGRWRRKDHARHGAQRAAQVIVNAGQEVRTSVTVCRHSMYLYFTSLNYLRSCGLARLLHPSCAASTRRQISEPPQLSACPASNGSLQRPLILGYLGEGLSYRSTGIRMLYDSIYWSQRRQSLSLSIICTTVRHGNFVKILRPAWSEYVRVLSTRFGELERERTTDPKQ